MLANRPFRQPADNAAHAKHLPSPGLKSIGRIGRIVVQQPARTRIFRLIRRAYDLAIVQHRRGTVVPAAKAEIGPEINAVNGHATA